MVESKRESKDSEFSRRGRATMLYFREGMIEAGKDKESKHIT